MSLNEFAGKRVSIYARFSSALQRETSIDDQVRRCRDYVLARGGDVPANMVFADSAVSGASLQRPSFERMMEAVETKQVDVIVTEDVSRISRDIADSANLFKRLQYLRVELRGVADGINTSDRSAKVTFTVKSLVSEVYLDDLRDKTLRGLEGRALAGFSTGGLPIGYTSFPETDAYGRVMGHRIEIDPAGKQVVDRIFQLYRDGFSYRAIAATFNAEEVPPPRAKTRHRRKGWVASTIREILNNDAYLGHWSFKEKQWSKVPGTNVRRYRRRPEHEIIRQHRPELVLVSQELWDEVHVRAQSVSRTYTQGAGGAPKGRATGRKNDYLLSGLLVCGLCGAAMTITKGTSAHYYKCGDYKKRGTCSNRKTLREDVARQRILQAVYERYRTPEAIAFLRQAIVDEIGRMARSVGNDLDERQARLARTEERIGGLVEFISRGDQSDYVRKTLLDLEAQAKQERGAIEGLRAAAKSPVQLPTPEAILAQCDQLETLVASDVLRAREALCALFGGQGLRVTPQEDGRYVAEGELDALRLFELELAGPGDKIAKAPGLSPGLTAGIVSQRSLRGGALVAGTRGSRLKLALAING